MSLSFMLAFIAANTLNFGQRRHEIIRTEPIILLAYDTGNFRSLTT